MTQRTLTAAICIFAIAVIASGAIRFLLDANGQNGLYFGLAMGGLAFLGAWLIAIDLVRVGKIVALFVVAVVLLWFTFDIYRDLNNEFKIGSAEVRKLSVIAVGASLLICFFFHTRESRDTASLATRASRLADDVGNGIRLAIGQTVHDDSANDVLCGGDEADLIFANYLDYFCNDPADKLTTA